MGARRTDLVSVPGQAKQAGQARNGRELASDCQVPAIARLCVACPGRPWKSVKRTPSCASRARWGVRIRWPIDADIGVTQVIGQDQDGVRRPFRRGGGAARGDHREEQGEDAEGQAPWRRRVRGGTRASMVGFRTCDSSSPAIAIPCFGMGAGQAAVRRTPESPSQNFRADSGPG